MTFGNLWEFGDEAVKGETRGLLRMEQGGGGGGALGTPLTIPFRAQTESREDLMEAWKLYVRGHQSR